MLKDRRRLSLFFSYGVEDGGDWVKFVLIGTETVQ